MKTNQYFSVVGFYFISISLFSQALQNRVLVIKNTNSPVSIAVADDYMLRRNVTKVLNIACQDSNLNSDSEWMSFSDYNSQIKNPVQNYLISHPEIDFIVLTKGIPNKVYAAPNKPYGGDCAVDSLLAALGYETSSSSSIVDFNIPDNGTFFTGQAYANKFWNSQVSFSNAAFGGFLVTRLDGYTQADAIALTTRSLQAEANIGIPNSGTILLDACGSFGFDSNFTTPNTILPINYVPGQALFFIEDYQYSNFNSEILLTNNQLISTGNSVQYENTENFIGNISNLNGYVSWGSNDTNYNPSLYNSLTFSAGAIAETAVSTGARTFLPTTGGQSLIANLIAQGVTGVKGYATEPLLIGVGTPNILFDRYTKGWTLAESFYASAKLVGWMDIMVGDPICRTYANPLAVNQNKSNADFAIYPNPSSDFIRINTGKNTKIIMSTILGKKVLEIENYKSHSDIDVSHLEKGIYFIKTNDTKSNILKFIKQ